MRKMMQFVRSGGAQNLLLPAGCVIALAFPIDRWYWCEAPKSLNTGTRILGGTLPLHHKKNEVRKWKRTDPSLLTMGGFAN